MHFPWVAAHRAVVFACLALAGACATVPPIDRYLLHSEAPVRFEGAHGPLSHAQSERILAELRKRSDATLIDRRAAVEQALAGTPLSVGNRVTLLEDGPATYAAMLQAIRGARRSVHLEMYIFEAGEVGRVFADALIARSKAGVKVRLIYDSVGSLQTPKEFFNDMKAADIEIVEFNPVAPEKALANGLELDHRDHRKLMVVDGRLAFVGGINISKVYGSLKRGAAGSTPSAPASNASAGGGDRDANRDPALDRPWRDTQVRIEGPVVAELQKIFVAQWARERKEPPLGDKSLFPQLGAVGDQVVRAIAGSPEQGANPMYVDLISAIDSAEKEVRITNAYFVPHDELLEALKDAARRGVEVKMILPSVLDSWIVLAAGRSYYEDLLAAGVKIYERKHRLLHAKTATVDGVWSTIGSTNLDWRSLNHNDELNVVVLGAEFAGRMNAVFDSDLGNSRQITLEAWHRRSPAERMREAYARMLALML